MVVELYGGTTTGLDRLRMPAPSKQQSVKLWLGAAVECANYMKVK